MRLAKKDTDFLAAFQRLGTRYPRALARLAVEQAILRTRAAEKFNSA